jgi:hypothetical protein
VSLNASTSSLASERSSRASFSSVSNASQNNESLYETGSIPDTQSKLDFPREFQSGDVNSQHDDVSNGSERANEIAISPWDLSSFNFLKKHLAVVSRHRFLSSYFIHRAN